MNPPFTEDLKEIADSMGIALYQRFSVKEASLFLHCPVKEVQSLQKKGNIEHIQVAQNAVEFFGYQLLQYLLSTVSGETTPQPSYSTPDRIIRAKEAQDMAGLSRTTLWRLEQTGDFPRRVCLGGNSVGWKLSEIKQWVDNK